jgi:flagellar basal body L-ring protein FlgH
MEKIQNSKFKMQDHPRIFQTWIKISPKSIFARMIVMAKQINLLATTQRNSKINSSITINDQRSTRANRREYKIEIKTKLAKDNTQAAAHTVDASNAKIKRHDTASWSAM